MPPELEPQAGAADLTADDFEPRSDPSPASVPAEAGTPGLPPAAAVESPTIRGLVQSLGYQLGEDVGDDYAAIVHLTQQAALAQQFRQQQQQGDVYAQLGRALAPRAGEINRFLQQGTQPQTPQRNPWEPPPFDDRWASLLKMDQNTGMYIAVHPNVPQDIVNAANDYKSWTEGFLRNPSQIMAQFAEHRERQLLETRLPQMLEERFRQEQTRQAVDGIVRQNATWFYAKDAEGNFLPDPMSGHIKISPLGQQYLAQLQWAAQAGIQDPVMRDQYARNVLRAEIAASAAPAAQPTATNAATAAARQNRYLPASRPQVNALQSLPRSQRQETPGATEPVATLSLVDMLRKGFRDEGLTDEHMLAEGAFAG